jgi:predicted GH43/DUF377 family glycosyl hydrolase
VNSVFNPGAVLLPSQETVLLVRAEGRSGISHLAVARSQDGLSGWTIDAQPTLLPEPDLYPEELWGIEDPRIAWLPELEQYAVTYTAYSSEGPLVSLALTRDFRTFERQGPILLPENKDAALFPRRFDGRWAIINRPVPHTESAKANIWLAYSSDMRHWGDHTLLLEARAGAYWDAAKIGLSTPPIETAAGWLLVYHGVRETAAGVIYRVGLALLDINDPRQVLARGEEWVFRPEAPYELSGDVPNVVFPCGAILDETTGQLRLYYGAADRCIGVATAPLSELLQWLEQPQNRCQ